MEYYYNIVRVIEQYIIVSRVRNLMLMRALRGRSAVTRAAVKVILGIRLLPFAVAAGERGVADSVRLQQSQEKNDPVSDS